MFWEFAGKRQCVPICEPISFLCLLVVVAPSCDFEERECVVAFTWSKCNDANLEEIVFILEEHVHFEQLRLEQRIKSRLEQKLNKVRHLLGTLDRRHHSIRAALPDFMWCVWAWVALGMVEFSFNQAMEVVCDNWNNFMDDWGQILICSVCLKCYRPWYVVYPAEGAHNEVMHGGVRFYNFIEMESTRDIS